MHRTWPTALFGFAALLALLAGACVPITANHRLRELWRTDPFARVEAALGEHFRAHGDYPESLAEISPELELTRFHESCAYQRHGRHYLLSCACGYSRIADAGLYCVYWSKDRKWRKSDFNEWPED